MHNEFTAVVEFDSDWFVAHSPEMPDASGHGKTRNEALDSLREAVALICKDRREDGLRGLPEDVDRTVVTLR